MSLPPFERLARLYHERMLRLFGGHLWEMMQNPSLAADPDFHHAALRIARGMVREVAHANAASWREAAMKSTRARQIYQALKAEIAAGGLGPELEQIARRNAGLISSVPEDIARRVTARASELQQRGARAAEIERELRKMAPALAKSRLKLIARTEISRSETDLTRARSERIGIDWYQWETSRDIRVRESHRNMNGVLVAWGDPPQPEELIGERSTAGRYHAGCVWNCRCVSLPLADISEVRWPCRVFTAGRIVRMTRTEFVRAYGIRIAA